MARVLFSENGLKYGMRTIYLSIPVMFVAPHVAFVIALCASIYIAVCFLLDMGRDLARPSPRPRATVQPPAQPKRIDRETAAVTDDWQRVYLSRCQSPPEGELLRELIREFQLAPGDGALVGQLRLELQKVIGSFRVDFLVNGKLVIEVDGRAYHANSESFETDRIRDQKLTVQGYTVLRFTANQVLSHRREVLEVIRRTVALRS